MSIKKYHVENETAYFPDVQKIDVYANRSLVTTITNPQDYNQRKLRDFLRTNYPPGNYRAMFLVKGSKESQELRFNTSKYWKAGHQKLDEIRKGVTKEIPGNDTSLTELQKRNEELIRENERLKHESEIKTMKKEIDELKILVKEKKTENPGMDSNMMLMLLTVLTGKNLDPNMLAALMGNTNNIGDDDDDE